MIDLASSNFPIDSVHRDVRRSYPSAPSEDTLLCLGRELKDDLVREGLLADQDAENGLNRWVTLIFQIAHKFSCYPFTAQTDILQEFQLSKPELLPLNKVMRNSDLVQKIICDFGEARKYWHNTIIPTVKSESFSAVLDKRYVYPFRVGLFPGQSCMFKCTFCGRNYDAKFDRASRISGNEIFRTMMDEAPNSEANRFYFSGGLEPLTNSEIGSLIGYSRELGFKTSMYTNGYMLTPNILAANAGIWELDALRLSLYGVDEDGAVAVTRKSGSFDRVKENVFEYVRARNAVGSNTKFGINFVILPENISQLLTLAELVCDLNQSAGGRGVEFVTLREDFSIAPEEGISASDRGGMLAVFEEFEHMIEDQSPSSVEIDYGYALQSVRDGFKGRPLEMVGDSEIRGSGYPQISVVVDLSGDVYIYREAGFLERPGANRYAIGPVTPDRSLQTVVQEFIESGKEVPVSTGDWKYLDAFDHVIVKLLNQAEIDMEIGIPFSAGPVRERIIMDKSSKDAAFPILAHPTLNSTRA
jgi:dTDP-4-amino-4,6-dideoxy-D-glucose ammonia-lyase